MANRTYRVEEIVCVAYAYKTTNDTVDISLVPEVYVGKVVDKDYQKAVI